jgi:hypothetical protein
VRDNARGPGDERIVRQKALDARIGRRLELRRVVRRGGGNDSAVSISFASAWSSVDAVTSTIGRFSASSHGGASPGGPHVSRPTRRTFAGQSLRGYS